MNDVMYKIINNTHLLSDERETDPVLSGIDTNESRSRLGCTSFWCTGMSFLT